MPLFVILTARYLTVAEWKFEHASAAVFAICAIFLLQFWGYYFESLDSSESISRHCTRRFWTAEVEPKKEVMEIIRQIDPLEGEKRVFADNWWIEHPMRFLLYRENPVVFATAGITPIDEQQGFFVVAIAGGDFARAAMEKLKGVKYQGYDVVGGNGEPVLVVIYVEPRS